MKLTVKIICLVIVCLMMASLLVACTDPCDNHADLDGDGKCDNCGRSMSGGEVELVFWCNNGYLADFELRIAEFTELTGIKVRVEGIQANSWGELAQQIATSAYAGALPDCGDLATEAMATMVAADMLEPLDDYIARDMEELKESIDQMDPVLYNAHKYNGKMYSLPTIYNIMCLYYNKNVLSEAGIEPTNPHYPHEGWTIEDFLYCCEQVTKDNVVGGTNNKYGYKIQNQYFLTIEPWLRSYNASILSSDWSQATINSAQAKQCFEMLYNMMNATDVKQQYSPKFGGTAEYDLFYSNRLAFMGNGIPYVYHLYTGGFNNSKNNVANLKAGYDVVSFPTVDGVSRPVIGVGACPVFKTSQHKEEAWMLAKFLSSKQFQEDFLTKTVWASPVIRSAAEILNQQDFMPEHGEIFYTTLQNATVIPAPAAYSAIELETRKWFGGYMAAQKGFTLSGEGKNSLDSIAQSIANALSD